MEISFDEVVALACSTTGLDDFGDEAFREPLRVLVDALNREASLTDRAMESERGAIVRALEMRLRAEWFRSTFPEIDDEPITAPVVIVGPQRSGTSKLYRLIASDPQWTKLYTWQAMFPVPFGDGLPVNPDPRLAAAEKACEELNWLQVAHEVDAHAPEMEAHILNLGFMTNSPTRIIPTHQRYCETADHTPVYRFLDQMLRFIQWQNDAPSKRWILKSPPHLLSLEELAKQYPDATLVMTHRHPVVSVASMLKLVELAQQNSAKVVDRDRIRDAWLRILTLNLERFLEFRDSHGDAMWVDVPYAELRGDSLTSVHRIYDHADAQMSSHTIASVSQWEQDNPQHKQGSFEYALEDYGLTEADVDREFADYIDRFGSMF
jgi:Sulfotransferase family